MSLKYSCCSSNTLHDKAISLHKPDTQTYLLKVLKRQQYTISFRFNSKIFICYDHLGIFIFHYRPIHSWLLSNVNSRKWKKYLPKHNDVIRGPAENKNRHNYNSHLECFCSCPIQHSGTWTSKPYIWIDKIEIWWQFW